MKKACIPQKSSHQLFCLTLIPTDSFPLFPTVALRHINFFKNSWNDVHCFVCTPSRNRVWNRVAQCPWNLNFRSWNRLFVKYKCPLSLSKWNFCTRRIDSCEESIPWATIPPEKSMPRKKPSVAINFLRFSNNLAPFSKIWKVDSCYSKN